MQLGKALNQPNKGISSLTKVVVMFTDQQKKQIKAMIKSSQHHRRAEGHPRGVEEGVRRVAEGGRRDLPGQMKRVNDPFSEDVSQQLVAACMPVLSTLVDILTKDVMPAFQKTVGFITKNIGWVGAVGVGCASSRWSARSSYGSWRRRERRRRT